MDDKDVLKFFYELEQLRQINNSGWHLIGAKPNSVAEHNLRVCQIGFVLAHMEGYNNPEEIATMLLFHDMSECRVLDLHKVAARYVKADELQAVKDQTAPLGSMGVKILDYWKQVDEKNTTAGVIAKDADLLEQAITAREYVERGYPSAQDWIDNVSKRLKTTSAKRLLNQLHDVKPTDWWQGLKKIPQ